jgi:hypothetical protein
VDGTLDACVCEEDDEAVSRTAVAGWDGGGDVSDEVDERGEVGDGSGEGETERGLRIGCDGAAVWATSARPTCTAKPRPASASSSSGRTCTAKPRPDGEEAGAGRSCAVVVVVLRFDANRFTAFSTRLIRARNFLLEAIVRGFDVYRQRHCRLLCLRGLSHSFCSADRCAQSEDGRLKFPIASVRTLCPSPWSSCS